MLRRYVTPIQALAVCMARITARLRAAESVVSSFVPSPGIILCEPREERRSRLRPPIGWRRDAARRAWKELAYRQRRNRRKQ